ncbi:MAG: cupin domain-containing protein [Novosphingobium sp.]|nr:cupin domain-containing protein [Novosphingobium sp.]
MNLHDDFAQRVLLHTQEMPWVPSPTAGVDRRMLDRIGGEVARATSIVRYAPGSRFPSHTHGGGEEFLVLEGVFQDEHGDYPAGCYVRNPPRSRHKPGSEAGCTIFVKLWQFDPADRTEHVAQIANLHLLAEPGADGVAAARLFADSRETVRIEAWAPGARIARTLPGGAELLVLEGACTEHGEAMQRLSWLRIPVGGALSAVAGPEGTRVWIKTGALRFAGPLPESAG